MTPEAPRHRLDTADFGALYEEDFSKGARMTPRMAYWLCTTSVYLADTWRDNRDDPELLIDSLPPLARPLAHGDWYDRFTDSFDALADRIAMGDGSQELLARCTAEEMALHLAIDLAEAHLADGLIGPDLDRAPELPDHGKHDRDFEAMRDGLFLDSDVLVLFDPLMDGAEIPDNEVDRVQRFSNLHPKDWFKPFAES